MANYTAASRTNYFRVTDEDKYSELFSNLTSEDIINDFTETKDGIIYHAFGCYGSIYYEDYETDNCSLESFLLELQKILPEDEAFMLFESGCENLRYVTGYSIVCTKKTIRYFNIIDESVKIAKQLLGNDFETQVDY